MVKLLMLLVLLKGLAIEVDVLGTRLRLLGRFAAGLLRLRVLALLLRVGQGLAAAAAASVFFFCSSRHRLGPPT